MNSLNLKVGGKVIIREDLVCEKCYDGVRFNKDMTDFKGKEVTVFDVHRGDRGFNIEEDEGIWGWNRDMVDVERTMTLKDRQLQESLTLSDLKSGHVVKLRNDETYIVMRNEFGGRDYMFNQVTKEHIDMPDFNDDMTSSDCYVDLKEFDIIEVYQPLWSYSLKCLNREDMGGIEEKYFKLVWKRKTKRMTIAEIEKELGYEIEVVSEGWSV